MADRLHVKPRHRAAVERLLSEHLPGVEAWAYGSRASGRSHDGSDLDLALRGPGLREIPAVRLAAFDDALRESNVPFLVEARDWARIPERFRREIERNHVVLAEKPRAASNAWRTTTVGEFCPFSYGRSLPGSLRDGTGHQVYGSNGPIGRHSRPLVESGVIVGRKGAVGSVHYSPAPFWPIDTAFYVAPGPERDIRFTYYLLCSLGLSRMNSDSAVPGLNRGDAHAIELRVPSLREQRAIARVLGALDDRIELNRRMNETLEATARAIFRDWFVDFGPVRAKMDGRQPYLPPEIWELFPQALDSQEIPDEWALSKIGEEVKIVGGGTPSTKEPGYWVGGQYNWATPKDLSTLRSPVLLQTARKITDAGVGKISSGLLPAGTVLMSSRAPIGYLAIAEVPTAINQGFIAMTCKGRLPNTFVLFWCSENLDRIKTLSSGTTFAEISKRSFRPIPIIVPTEKILSAYNTIVQLLYSRIVVNVEQNDVLSDMRDILLHKFMSGEIRMSDAEHFAGGMA